MFLNTNNPPQTQLGEKTTFMLSENATNTAYGVSRRQPHAAYGMK